jgi:hypothetical protein
VIRGYPARPSVKPGQTLALHVATDAPRFRVAFHRWRDGFEPVHVTDWLPGLDAPPGPPDDDWRWPQHLFDIPRHWPSGVYVAHLQEPDAAAPPDVAMAHAAALFVVRGAGRHPLLYKLPIATYQAYNVTGGGCFYHQPPRSRDPARPGARLTWQRPGGGIGGDTFGALDHYDASSPRQTFAHWDAPFIRWLAQRGIEPEFCTDLDVHDDPSLLGNHRLLLSVGHDEYWSESMRAQVERFVGDGGNVAFFGANLCWWRIHLVDDASAMVCHQGGPKGALDHWWAPSGAQRPEDALTGVSYRHGGGWWDGAREAEGFIVQDGGHWAFAGTGLRSGERFGAASTPPLVGYECDGAPLVWADAARGRVALAPDAAACGTPPGWRPLAVGPLNAGWQELPHREGRVAGEGLHNAAMGLYRRGERGGSVFTTGTTDWAQVLANGSDPAVPLITRNVIERLGGVTFDAR